MAASLFEPVALGPLALKNRVIRAAAFEGMADGHLVTPALIQERVPNAWAWAAASPAAAFCAIMALSPAVSSATHSAVPNWPASGKMPAAMPRCSSGV